MPLNVESLMKKVSLIAVCVLMTSILSSCGQSEEARKAEEERLRIEADSTKNSIKQDIASQMDSLKKPNGEDSLVKVEEKK